MRCARPGRPPRRSSARSSRVTARGRSSCTMWPAPSTTTRRRAAARRPSPGCGLGRDEVACCRRAPAPRRRRARAARRAVVGGEGRVELRDDVDRRLRGHLLDHLDQGRADVAAAERGPPGDEVGEVGADPAAPLEDPRPQPTPRASRGSARRATGPSAAGSPKVISASRPRWWRPARRRRRGGRTAPGAGRRAPSRSSRPWSARRAPPARSARTPRGRRRRSRPSWSIVECSGPPRPLRPWLRWSQSTSRPRLVGERQPLVVPHRELLGVAVAEHHGQGRVGRRRPPRRAAARRRRRARGASGRPARRRTAARPPGRAAAGRGRPRAARRRGRPRHRRRAARRRRRPGRPGVRAHAARP